MAIQGTRRDGGGPHRSRAVRAVTVAAVVLLVAAGLLFGGRAMQHTLAYHPSRSPLPPASSVLPWAEDVTLTTSDGLDMTAWFVAPAPTSAARDQAVLLAHGNGGDLSGRVHLAERLADRGFAVLLVGYRGYARNPGTPSEEGLIRDARAAQEHLESRGFSAAQTIYLGESIGTGVVTGLATQVAPGGLVLRSPFTSLHDVGTTLIPVPPLVRFIMDRNHYPVAEQVAALHVPVTVLYGTADEVVPASQSAAVARSARLLFDTIAVENARHNDGVWQGAVVVDAVEALADFLRAR